MDELKSLTQEQIFAAEAYFNLATMIGKCLQISVYQLNHPDQKQKILVFDPGKSADEPDNEPAGPAGKAPTDKAPVPLTNGRISSNELSIEAQVEQLICLYDPRIKDILGPSSLYEMFHLASGLFSYDLESPEGELSPLDKRKIAIAWVIVKRVFAVNHPTEALHLLNLPDVIAGDIIYNAAPLALPMDEQDRQFIVTACNLCAAVVVDNIPLQQIVDDAIRELEKEDKAAKLATLSPLAGLPNSAPINWMIKALVNTSTTFVPVSSPSGSPAALKYYEKAAGSKKKTDSKYIPSKDTAVIIGKKYYRRIDRYVESSRINRHRQVNVYRSDKALISEEIGEDGNKYIFKLTNPDKFAKDKTFVKLLFFVLQKWNEQQYADRVGFALQELVDIGMYSKPANALRAIRTFFEQQTNSMMSGSLKIGNKTIKANEGVLFYNLELNNGFIELSVNRKFNFDFIASQFTSFPRSAYSLDNINAFLLVHYIFSLARQNADKIKATGTFNISLRAVQENIGLPSPENVKENMNRRYKQLIIDPIEKAIEDIETWTTDVPEAKDFGLTITPIVNDSAGIFEWISGHLEIGLNGEFAQKFIDIASRNEKIRENRARLAAKRQAAREKTEG